MRKNTRNWSAGRGAEVAPAEPSRWEIFTAVPRTDQEVENWIKNNVHSAYVPEHMIHRFGVKVYA